MKFVNTNGLSQIAAFLTDEHRNPDTSPRALNAWACEAEDSLSNDGAALIEIPARDSKSGVPVTLTITAEGLSE